MFSATHTILFFSLLVATIALVSPPTRKRRAPRPSRIRKRIDRVSDGTTKSGLPRALYHRRYLAGLVPSMLTLVSPQNTKIPQFSEEADKYESDSMVEE